jgi:hypothetical protein
LSPVFSPFAFSNLSGKAVDGGIAALTFLSLISGRVIDLEEYLELEFKVFKPFHAMSRGDEHMMKVDLMNFGRVLRRFNLDRISMSYIMA